MVIVRAAQLHEAPVLARLHRSAALLGYGHIFPDDAPPPTHDELIAEWEHWLTPDRERGWRAYVAQDGARVLGLVRAGPDRAEVEAGHLGRLYVEPEHWGRGIGGRLYQEAIEQLTGAGFTYATLWVLEGNTRARRWYECLGWQQTGERKPVYAPASIDDLRYRLALRRTAPGPETGTGR